MIDNCTIRSNKTTKYPLPERGETNDIFVVDIGITSFS